MLKIKPFISARLRRCRSMLAEKQLAGLIVLDPADVSYLTGFQGDDSVLVLTAGKRLLITDTRFTVQAHEECPGLPLLLRKEPMTEAIAEAYGKLQPGRRGWTRPIGIEKGSITLGQYQTLRKKTGRTLEPVEGIVTELRQAKDGYEIAQITKAIRIAEDAFVALRDHIRLGMSEAQLKARLEYEMSVRGSTVPSFPSIVAFAGHAAQPHAIAGNARLRGGQPLLCDWGATLNGYRSDLTRCLAAGRISPVFAEAYQLVLEAQLSAIQAVKPGAALAEVDAAARKTIRRPWPVYGHGTGHGLGLNVHEAPRLGPKIKGALREGMVVTVEPGMYLPGRFGIRIEDDVLVTARGGKVLSRLDKSLESVRLEI